MLAFLKKWRQAYRDEKGDRLHAEVEAERNALLSSTSLSFEEVNEALVTKPTLDKSMSWKEAFFKAHNDCTLYEEEQAYYKKS
ncbi:MULTISPECIES: hypothetical protein [unclassified Vibrio]|uniref:hypothetical protein n=1 Tax=unclassified Vibrio TaxID=2614977 RepID=UPI000C831EE5|nr:MULTISPECIES: hypothetical protein [unclassified Vibrio]PMK75782.1 hypothetical protein BCT92_23575 [Vibrio sp. 10N.261.52.E5]TKF78914.1 hypothetical protein FCV65_22745 [Vibrio sp. F13]CAK3361105.1 conserved hypothetical protein [Vibrio crassostreae]CAK3962406.1 conserved hypothetical protein [Vibrio crassostreae]